MSTNMIVLIGNYTKEFIKELVHFFYDIVNLAILEVFLFTSQIQQGRFFLFWSGGYSLASFFFFENMGNGYNITFLFHATMNSIDI